MEEWWVKTTEEGLSAETHWEKAAKTRMGRYLTRIETEFIMSSADFTRCKFILDVGAEAGRFSLLAAMSQADVLGIDIDSYGLRRLRMKNKQVDVILADARRVPLQGEVFDAVFMIEVLDYIPELETAFSECYSMLKHGGSLVVSFGNKSSLKSIFKEKIYQHSYSQVLRRLNHAGFEIKKKIGYNWLPFSRISEIPFIPLLARIEKLFGLRRVCRFSPWVLVYAIKPEERTP